MALACFEPNLTYFFDSGTTIYALAEAFREHPVTPVTVVTSNLPVCEMLASIPGVQAFLLAGQLLHLQSTLLGETAQKSLEFWNFDVAFLSAEAMDERGLWNSQAAIVEQQKVVLRRSTRTIFCIDGTKLNRAAPHFLLPWDRVDALLTDASQEKLQRAGDRSYGESTPRCGRWADGFGRGGAGRRRGREAVRRRRNAGPFFMIDVGLKK
jgi:DeoR/GlpR family transcriptional regulator of sugar metabolism